MRQNLLVVAGIFVSACATLPAGGPQSTRPPSSSTITAQQIADAHASNVWDLLQRLAPRYDFQENREGRAVGIRSDRGPSSIIMRSSDVPLVVIDGARLVDATVLQQMSTGDVRSIDLMDGLSGTTFFGTGSGAGVIYIHTRLSPEH